MKIIGIIVLSLLGLIVVGYGLFYLLMLILGKLGMGTSGG
jgi:hypothetical protein